MLIYMKAVKQGNWLSNSNAEEDDDVFRKEAPANFVPAAAVIRGGRALFAKTGRKGSLGGLMKVDN